MTKRYCTLYAFSTCDVVGGPRTPGDVRAADTPQAMDKCDAAVHSREVVPALTSYCKGRNPAVFGVLPALCGPFLSRRLGTLSLVLAPVVAAMPPQGHGASQGSDDDLQWAQHQSPKTKEYIRQISDHIIHVIQGYLWEYCDATDSLAVLRSGMCCVSPRNDRVSGRVSCTVEVETPVVA